MRGGKIGGERFRTVGHSRDGIISVSSLQAKSVIPPRSAATSPADVASRCRTADSRAAPARSSPRRRPALGQRKRPRSSRFVNRQAPWPSCQITFSRSPRRPRKQNRWPLSGSRCSTSCTCSAGWRSPSACRCGRSPATPARRSGTGSSAPVPLANARSSPTTIARSVAPVIRSRAPLANSTSIVPARYGWLSVAAPAASPLGASAVAGGSSATSTGGERQRWSGLRLWSIVGDEPFRQRLPPPAEQLARIRCTTPTSNFGTPNCRGRQASSTS